MPDFAERKKKKSGCEPGLFLWCLVQSKHNEKEVNG